MQTVDNRLKLNDINNQIKYQLPKLPTERQDSPQARLCLSAAIDKKKKISKCT